MIILHLILALMVMLFLNCSSPTSSGNGTGTDTGDAKIYGCVKLPDNNAGNNITVTLRKQDYVPYSISLHEQVKTTSGSDGGFMLSMIAPGYYLVELHGNDSLCAIKRFRISVGDTIVQLGDLMLDTSEMVTGTVVTDGIPATGGNLLVIGLDKTGPIANDGSFSVRLPSGSQLFRIVTVNGQSTGDVLFSAQGTNDTIRTNTLPATVLDDFENSDGLNSLSPLLGGGNWFAFTDSVNGGKSTIQPTEQPGLVAAIDMTANAYKGGSLHCYFTIDQSFSAPFALIGMDICNSKDANSTRSWFDLTRMTALSFLAKGTGTIIIQFTCKPIGTSTDFLVYEVPVTLASAWSKQTIRSSDIPNERLSGTPWGTGGIAVSNINFLATGTAELWLDELTAEGMSVTDFLK